MQTIVFCIDTGTRTNCRCCRGAGDCTAPGNTTLSNRAGSATRTTMQTIAGGIGTTSIAKTLTCETQTHSVQTISAIAADIAAATTVTIAGFEIDTGAGTNRRG